MIKVLIKALSCLFISSVFVILIIAWIKNDISIFIDLNWGKAIDSLFDNNILKQQSTKDLVNSVITVVGFVLTSLGFGFVVFQVSALATQINKQEEQYHKDSEFKNFLEATKMLTSAENKINVIAKISAMYLLYDYAKKYSSNIEKVIQVLNRFSIEIFYNQDYIYFFPKDIIFPDKITISEWKDKGNHKQQAASVALELVKNLFAYAIEKNVKKINLSGVILFNFDIEIDIKNKTSVKLFDKFERLDRTKFLFCNFSDNHENRAKSEICFSTDKKNVPSYNYSNVDKLDITLSTFYKCDLTYCDFSYSNLWGTQFKDCTLTNTEFENTECLGSEFIGTKISNEQLEKMLFIDIEHFHNFRESLKYGVIYAEENCCFTDIKEYEKFIKYKQGELIK